VTTFDKVTKWGNWSNFGFELKKNRWHEAYEERIGLSSVCHQSEARWWLDMQLCKSLQTFTFGDGLQITDDGWGPRSSAIFPRSESISAIKITFKLTKFGNFYIEIVGVKGVGT